MNTTTPIFIVGSGRSGSRMLYKLLSGVPDVEVYHEYLCTHIQPLSAKYYMGKVTKKQAKEEIQRIHGSAIYYSLSKYWVDSSNKLSWIIEPLHEMYPNAIFIHVVRDGRKVVTSFARKLAAEIYDDVSTQTLRSWLIDPKHNPEPPAEKKYWWNIPQKGQPLYKEFSSYNQFQRICYHWREVNRVIEESFKKLPKKQYWTVKLEDLTTKKETLKKFLTFFHVPLEQQYFDFVQKPQGVFFPMDMKMNAVEEKQFNEICGSTMKRLGYAGKHVYSVKY